MRYSVIIHAPIAGWRVFQPTTRAAMRRVFQATGAAMRYRLVPALVPHASDAQLAQLAANDAVTIGSRRLRAVDTGREVIVSVGDASGGFAAGDVYLIEDPGTDVAGGSTAVVAAVGAVTGAAGKWRASGLWRVDHGRATVTDMA